MSTNQKSIVVTGVSRGLGAALCTHFIEAGHRVWGCARDASRIREWQNQYAKTLHRFDCVDVMDHRDVDQWAKALMDSSGAPDLLVNNAAIINQNAPLWQVPPDEFARVMQINIAGTYHVIRAFLPAMMSQGQGGVINFSSGWGQSTAPDVAPYCASKWAIEGLTQALAQEIPAGMFAVALNPGIINTEMLQSCFGSSASSYPTAAAWAEAAAPFLLELGPDANGQSLQAPSG